MFKGAITVLFLMLIHFSSLAQCSICSKTAQQLGSGPAAGMNSGIIYLALIPLGVISIIGFRWWRNEKSKEK